MKNPSSRRALLFLFSLPRRTTPFPPLLFLSSPIHRNSGGPHLSLAVSCRRGGPFVTSSRRREFAFSLFSLRSALSLAVVVVRSSLRLAGARSLCSVSPVLATSAPSPSLASILHHSSGHAWTRVSIKVDRVSDFSTRVDRVSDRVRACRGVRHAPTRVGHDTEAWTTCPCFIGYRYPDEILSTKIIGDRQFKTAQELFKSAKEELTGKIDYRHVYVNFTDIEVELEGNRVVKTCPAAVGAGFAAGTTDGPGQFGFQQGDTEINPFWKLVRNLLKKPSAYQEKCQKPKPVLLSTGEMFHPYAWAPAILRIQMLRFGQLIILSVPGEFTTMAGRRLREAVKETLISNGNGEFREDLQVVIAGLTNTYSQYVATFEEYTQQRYEAASTVYGLRSPHVISLYPRIQEISKSDGNRSKGP